MAPSCACCLVTAGGHGSKMRQFCRSGMARTSSRSSRPLSTISPGSTSAWRQVSALPSRPREMGGRRSCDDAAWHTQQLAALRSAISAMRAFRPFIRGAAFRLLVLKKRNKDDIAEEEAILEMYKEALGMWPCNKRRHCPGSDQSKHGPSSTVPAAWAVLAQPGNAVASAADALARRARFSGCSSRSRSAAAKLVVSSGGTNSRASAGTVSGTAPVAQLTMGRPWLSASSKTMP